MTLSTLTRNGALALALAASFATAATVATVPAFAADAAAAKAVVDAAKARGEVGEQGDGYIGIVGSVGADVRAAVTEINNGRAGVYRETAAKTGVTAEAAGQAAARQLESRIPPGQFFKPLDGSWVKK